MCSMLKSCNANKMLILYAQKINTQMNIYYYGNKNIYYYNKQTG